MTNVYMERDGDRYKLICKNHAPTKEACAAVSTLCQTYAGYLHNIECEITEEHIQPGDVRICVKSDTPEAASAYFMTAVGFLQLEHSYPGTVSVDLQEIS